MGRQAALVLSLAGIVLVLHAALPDGIRGTLLLALCSSNNTVYSDNYSEIGFMRVAVGMSAEEVESILGHPIEETWIYHVRGASALESNLVLKSGLLVEINIRDTDAREMLKNVNLGMKQGEVTRLLGRPARRIMFYTGSRSKDCYKERKIIFDAERVSSKEADVYVD